MSSFRDPDDVRCPVLGCGGPWVGANREVDGVRRHVQFCTKCQHLTVIGDKEPGWRALAAMRELLATHRDGDVEGRGPRSAA